MTDKHLHPVPDQPCDGAEAETEATTPDPETLEDAVKTGRYRDVLKAQQLEVARLLDEGAGAQTAQLHRTLTSLSRELRDYDDLIGATRRPRTPDEKFKGA